VSGAPFDPGCDRSAEDEEEGGGQKKPRYQVEKRRGGRMEQNMRSQDAADDARDDKSREKAARFRVEGVPIGEGAGYSSRPQRGRVCGVRCNRPQAGEKQRRECNEAPAASNGIEGAAKQRGEEEENRMVDVHSKE